MTSSDDITKMLKELKEMREVLFEDQESKIYFDIIIFVFIQKINLMMLKIFLIN